MRYVTRALCAGGVGLAALTLAACGSGGSLLSHSQASSLNRQLGQISQALSARQCQQASNEISNFQNSVDAMSGVDQSLIGNLDQGAQTVAQLASTECPTTQRTHTTPTTTNTTPTTPTQTATTTPTPPVTSTTTTPTTTQTTPSTTTTTTPSGGGSGSGGAGLPGGGGDGTGGGNGNGNG
jgi:hypothetical protein